MTIGVREQYRQRKGSDVWHFHPACRWWPREVWFWSNRTLDPKTSIAGHPPIKGRYEKPTTGEFCNECLAKEKRDRQ